MCIQKLSKPYSILGAFLSFRKRRWDKELWDEVLSWRVLPQQTLHWWLCQLGGDVGALVGPKGQEVGGGGGDPCPHSVEVPSDGLRRLGLEPPGQVAVHMPRRPGSGTLPWPHRDRHLQEVHTCTVAGKRPSRRYFSPTAVAGGEVWQACLMEPRYFCAAPPSKLCQRVRHSCQGPPLWEGAQCQGPQGLCARGGESRLQG